MSHIPCNTFIYCDGDPINPRTHVRNLGIHFDLYMVFHARTSELSKKLIGILMFTIRISNNFDKKTKILIVQSLTLCLMNYCIGVWGWTKNVTSKYKKNWPNSAFKVAIGGVRKYDHACEPFIQRNKWLTVAEKKKHAFKNVLLSTGLPMGCILSVILNFRLLWKTLPPWRDRCLSPYCGTTYLHTSLILEALILLRICLKIYL